MTLTPHRNPGHQEGGRAHKGKRVNKALGKAVVKTLAGFLNGKQDATLLIGVNDDGAAVGLADDYGTLKKKKNRDGFELHLRQLIAQGLGEAVSAYLTVTFHEVYEKDICQVTVTPSDHAVYVEDRSTAVFYLRTGNLTKPLPVDEVVKYVQHRWGRQPVKSGQSGLRT